MDRVLSVTEYAEMNGKDPGNIRRYLASGRMEGYKIGNQWVIPEDAAYPVDRREKTGRYRNWRKGVNLRSNKELMSVMKHMSDQLHDIYKGALQEVIIYGSYARGTETDESDVDIAIMLSEEPTKVMTDKMISCVAEHELYFGKVLSAIEISVKQFDKWKEAVPFYKNVEKEGITVWKAA